MDFYGWTSTYYYKLKLNDDAEIKQGDELFEVGERRGDCRLAEHSLARFTLLHFQNDVWWDRHYCNQTIH